MLSPRNKAVKRTDGRGFATRVRGATDGAPSHLFWRDFLDCGQYFLGIQGLEKESFHVWELLHFLFIKIRESGHDDDRHEHRH